MRIALIKMSSMGDVIHALPIVTDILKACPGAQIDWIVEEPFADLARLHPAVAQVLPVSLRRWRKQWRSRESLTQLRQTRASFASRHYDLVLDLQGLLKSAWVASWVNGPRAGYHRSCARESLAALSYQQCYRVDLKVHAIEKMRSLAAQALGYEVKGLPLFSLRAPAPEPALEGIVGSHKAYWVFLHATSRPEKLWPQGNSVAFLKAAAQRAMPVLLPWGSEAERVAATGLVQQAQHGVVLPRLSLSACAAMLGQAQAVVGVDTGLTHLSAALDRPTVALFAATEAWRYGPYWTARAASLGEPGQWPDASTVVDHLDTLIEASL